MKEQHVCAYRIFRGDKIRARAKPCPPDAVGRCHAPVKFLLPFLLSPLPILRSTALRAVAAFFAHSAMERLQVRVCLEDVSFAEGARAAVAEADALAPVAGIMHLAMVLDDAPLTSQACAL